MVMLEEETEKLRKLRVPSSVIQPIDAHPAGTGSGIEAVDSKRLRRLDPPHKVDLSPLQVIVQPSVVGTAPLAMTSEQ